MDRVIRSVILLASAATRLAAQSLQITSPADGTMVRPGETVTVEVKASGAFQTVVVLGPLGFSNVQSAAPYQFAYPIPKDTTPGRYHIVAFGVVVRDQPINSDPLDLTVERADRPTNVSTEFSTLDFGRVGDFHRLMVIGKYADGSQAIITESRSTTFRSENPSVATVNATGIVTAVAPGTTRIAVNGVHWVPVTVRPPLMVRPPRRTMHAAESQRFDIIRFDTSVSGVTWSIAPASLGSITPSGVYTAPASIPSQRTVTVTAINPDNPKQVSTATVTLLPGRRRD